MEEVTEVPEDYLDQFIAGYALCMLWANTYEASDENSTGEVDPYAWIDGRPGWQLRAFAPAGQRSITEDCEAFCLANWADLSGLDPEQCGHDFALTRNGHGAGFWDRGLGEAGNRLTEACKPYGSSNAWYIEGSSDPCVHLGDERA